MKHKKSTSPKSKMIMRRIISCILAFMLSVCMALTALLIIIRLGVISENVLYDNLNSSRYYTFVYNELMGNIKSITVPTGFPEDIYKAVITETDIYSDINGSIRAQFKKISYTTKAAVIQQQLNKNIIAYFDEIGYTVESDEESKLIADYVRTVAEEYNRCIGVPLSTYIIKADRILDKVFWAAAGVLVFAMAAIIFIIFRLYKSVYWLLKYFSYALTGNAFMLLAYPAWMYIGRIYYRLNLSPESFYNLIIKYIDNILRLCLYFGTVSLLVGIAFATPGIFKKSR